MVPLTAMNIFNSIYALRSIQSITTAQLEFQLYEFSTFTYAQPRIAFINGLAQGLLVSAPLRICF